MKTALVTAANDKFFDLVSGLIQSFHDCPESSELGLCVLDVGLTSEQVSTLKSKNAKVVKPGWDLQFNSASCPEWFKALVARPHFPKHFPEYDAYVSIDADAWLCNWDGVALLIKAMKTSGFAIVPELDRSYAHCYQLRPNVTKNVRETYVESFGEETARLADAPIINAGVFAMRRDLPFWDIWAKTLHGALQRSIRSLSEQCALNYCIYTGQIKAHFLPSWCNWNCSSALPVLNPSTRQLHSPAIPFEQISICHLVDAKRQVYEIQGTDGFKRKLALTYDAIRKSDLDAAKVTA